MLVAQFQIVGGDGTTMQDYETYFTLEKGDTFLASKPFLFDTDAQVDLAPYVKYSKEMVDGEKNFTFTYDLSDFRQHITDDLTYKITLHVDIASSSKTDTEATINFLNIYGYNGTDKKYDATSKDFSLNSTCHFLDSTQTPIKALSVEISGITASLPDQPIVRAISLEGENGYTTREMTDAEKWEINNSMPDTPVVIDGHGTGLVKAKDISAYDGMLVTESNYSESKAVQQLTQLKSVDNSKPIDGKVYFPPAGDQGQTGSCGAFSSVYYIMTYEMAREHKTDLTGITFAKPDKNVETTWGPSDTSKVMSPAFLYHLANGGGGGTSGAYNLMLLGNLGCCTWEKMGSKSLYGESDPPTGQKKEYSQPSSEAYREAITYRLADYYSFYEVTSPKGMADIMTIAEQIQTGHCLYLSMDSTSLYHYFNDNGVMVGAYDTTATNHAQTIVGYVTGEEYEKLLTEKGYTW